MQDFLLQKPTQQEDIILSQQQKDLMELFLETMQLCLGTITKTSHMKIFLFELIIYKNMFYLINLTRKCLLQCNECKSSIVFCDYYLQFCYT